MSFAIIQISETMVYREISCERRARGGVNRTNQTLPFNVVYSTLRKPLYTKESQDSFTPCNESRISKLGRSGFKRLHRSTAFFTFLQLTYDEKKLLKLPNRVGLMKNYLLCTPANDKRTTAGTFIDEGGHE